MANFKFTQLSAQLNYPPNIRAKLSTLHSAIITYVVEDYHPTNQYKQKVIDVMNSITYHILKGDTIPPTWKSTDPLANIDSIYVDNFTCESELGKLYLHVHEINWDLTENVLQESLNSKLAEKLNSEPTLPPVTETKVEASVDTKSLDVINSIAHTEPTPKEHLYIRPPVVPQFDVNKPYLDINMYGTSYKIYTSLPEIPTNQSQISITTDISKFSDSDYLNLYPNRFIKTRASVMYEPYGGLTLDPDIGIVLPIEGFTEQEVRENIIKYPHIFKLTREIDGKLESFYSKIEINEKLYDTLSIWNDLADSKKMLKTSEYIKEYVVRRYLLERDIKGIKHKYPIFGDLSEFLTLFTTPEGYANLGFPNSIDLAKQCVLARIRYKQSRNPIMRMVNRDA